MKIQIFLNNIFRRFSIVSIIFANSQNLSHLISSHLKTFKIPHNFFHYKNNHSNVGNWCKFDLIKNLLPEKCTPIELLSNLRKISFPIEDDQVCTISSACITTDDSSGLYLDTDKFVKLIDWRSKTLSQIEFDNENLKAINAARIHNGTAYQVNE